MSKIKALDFLKKLELGAGSFSAYVLMPEASIFIDFQLLLLPALPTSTNFVHIKKRDIFTQD